jgi:glucoamylase
MAGKKKGLSRLKKHASTILAGTMVSVCALSPSMPDQVQAQTHEDAPGQPGISSAWTTGAKNGIGTAFYNPKDGVSKSNVWYTLTNGILSEVYYPDVTRANLQEMQVIVTDGKSFVDFEKEDTTHQIRLVHQDAPVYKQINTDKEGKYRIEKTYITDPDHHTVLSQVTFYALKGKVSHYKLMVYSNPSVNNSGMDDTAKVVKDGPSSYLVASQADTAVALTASVPFSKASSGYAGKSDGMEELKKNFKLESLFQSAENGNVAQIAELDSVVRKWRNSVYPSALVKPKPSRLNLPKAHFDTRFLR